MYEKKQSTLVWEHPRGLDEYVGNNYSEYYGVGILYPGSGYAVGVSFDTIKLPFYILQDGKDLSYYVNVFRAVKFIGWKNTRTIDSLTLIESFTVQGKDFNQNPDGFQVIEFPNIIKIDQYTDVVILATATSGTVKMGIRNWSTDASSNPARTPQFSYNDLTGLESGKTWNSGFSCVPPLLSLSDLTPSDIKRLSSINGQLSTLLNDKFDKPLIDLAIPSNIYIAIGRELNLWNDAVALYNNPNVKMQYYNNTSVSKGAVKERSFRLTPTATGTYAVDLKVKDQNNKTLSKKSFTINAVAKDNGSGIKQILVLGDSLIASANAGSGNVVTTELRNLIVADGGFTPLMLGTQYAPPNNNEGRGGWAFTHFTTGYSTNGYKFIVTGITTPPIGGVGVYTNNGCVFNLKEVVLSGGDGYIVAEKMSGTSPSASGTLTRTAGSGDATITFTSVTTPEVLNPFWDGTRNNFKAYMSEFGNFGGSDTIDFVCINLGLNDLATWILNREKYLMVAGVETVITNMKLFVDSVLDATYGYPTAKIILGLSPISGITRDGFAANNFTGYDKENSEWLMRQLWKRMIEEFDEDAYSEQVRLSIGGLMVDRLYGYSRTLVYTSARDTTNQVYEHDNAVHPGIVGYYQMADAFYSSIRGWL